MDFTGFLGNDAVKARLSGAFASGRVAHSYLLCGPAGSGKHTLTRILSAAMQCEGRSGKIPCGVCSGCRKALEGVHPDIITVDDPDHKAMTVDPIRAARSDMFIRPNEGKRKIYIIPRGQDMNESAQNALLKILEEPPDYGVFLILSTNAERLLPTIRSRCAELQLGPVAQLHAARVKVDLTVARDLAVHQRDGNHAERVLKLGMLIEVVQHDGRIYVGFQLDGDTHAFAVRFVP